MSDSTLAADLYVDRVEARAYVHGTEIANKIKVALQNLLPEKIQKKAKFSTQQTEGHLHTPITVIIMKVGGKKNGEDTFSHLLELLSERDRMNLLHTIDRRLNEKCVLFMRVDKQAAYLEKIQLGMDADIIKLQFHFRQYPKCNFEKAIQHIIMRIKNSGASS